VAGEEVGDGHDVHTGGLGGLDPVKGVLHRDALGRGGSQGLCGLEEEGGVGLGALHMLAGDHLLEKAV